MSVVYLLWLEAHKHRRRVTGARIVITHAQRERLGATKLSAEPRFQRSGKMKTNGVGYPPCLLRKDSKQGSNKIGSILPVRLERLPSTGLTQEAAVTLSGEKHSRNIPETGNEKHV